ncbi:hypothetical protein AGOR_G00057950 [Albula goreensis]|uniref:Fibronectin type-III domain-containing protein n=1 Tax=Albula goreensis TaxID=1534307 RepID=A0A8T3DTG1_9TELE|nr:hypothetical protein AGOR_G00057950 [Albula goreensis]
MFDTVCVTGCKNMNIIREFALVCVCCLLTWLPNAAATLSSPWNLMLQTLNTQYILKWEWHQQPPANQTVTFTTQYLHKFKMRKRRDWTSVCEESPEMQCDLTSASLNYHGVFVLRVRAGTTVDTSEWVLKEFCPDEDADLGPPSEVKVTPGDGLLRIRISDPLTSNNVSMREALLPEMYYLIQYWRQSQQTEMEEKMGLVTSSSDVTLKLASWAMYCVRVRSHYDFYNKTSIFSPVHCLQTTGQTPSWLIILVLCPITALLSYILFRYVPVIKTTFYPSSPLPISIGCDSSPGSDQPWLLAPESMVEVYCEKLDLFPKVLPEQSEMLAPPPGDPPVLHPDSCNRSRDSGMYSAEEGSAQLGQASAEEGLSSGPPGGAKTAERGQDSGIGRLTCTPGDSLRELH